MITRVSAARVRFWTWRFISRHGHADISTQRGFRVNLVVRKETDGPITIHRFDGPSLSMVLGSGWLNAGGRDPVAGHETEAGHVRFAGPRAFGHLSDLPIAEKAKIKIPDSRARAAFTSIDQDANRKQGWEAVVAAAIRQERV